MVGHSSSGKSEVYPDDMPFVVPGADGAARLWQADTSLVNCTKQPSNFFNSYWHAKPIAGSDMLCSDTLGKRRKMMIRSAQF